MKTLEYRIVVLGSGRVGKSALAVQYVHSWFEEKWNLKLENWHAKQMEVDGQQCVLEILDISGTAQLSPMHDTYRSAHGFILMYSIINKLSFINLKSLRQQILRARGGEDVPMILVGNKTDLENHRDVTTREGMILAKSCCCDFFELSAKSNSDANKIFHHLVKQINTHYSLTNPST